MKKDTIIEILDTQCASWLEKGKRYLVSKNSKSNSGIIYLSNLDGSKLPVEPWSCIHGNSSYKITNNIEEQYEIY